MVQMQFVYKKIGLLFQGEGDLQSLSFVLIILLFLFVQSRNSLKIYKNLDFLKKTDPILWPFYIAASVSGFFLINEVYTLLLSYNYRPHPNDFKNTFMIVGTIISVILFLAWTIVQAMFYGIVYLIYSSVIIHFSIITLFSGVLVALADYFIKGEVKLSLMYLNFLDSTALLDFLPFHDNTLIATISFLATISATIYRFISSYDLLSEF